MSMIFVGDIVEQNGKTIRQNNMSIEHKFKLGSLVEIDMDGDDYVDEKKKGIRLWVVEHLRDCDGTPLYGLSFTKTAKAEFDEAKSEYETAAKRFDEFPYDSDARIMHILTLMNKERASGKILTGYSEDSLVLIKEPKNA